MTDVRRVLTVNVGSSSVKLSVVEGEDTVAERSLGTDDDLADALGDLTWAHPVDAVGHRVVHGGSWFDGPVVVDTGVREHIEALVPLAPLHQPGALAGIDAARTVLPQVPSVACFDTTFHTGLPVAAATYAVPAEWRDRWDVRRYGAHGLSHAYATRRAGELGGPYERLVTCHLGSGASLCAVRDGHSVDTTMGFTPLEGLVMGSRSGTVDPGLVLWLVTEAGMDPGDVRTGLEEVGGLRALVGVSDMSEVLDRHRDGDPRAVRGLEVYLHRLVREIGGMVAALEGLDAILFTGGVGEAVPEVRREVLRRLAFTGVRVDDTANEDGTGDRVVSADGSDVTALVVHSREDLEMVRQCRALLEAR